MSLLAIVAIFTAATTLGARFALSEGGSGTKETTKPTKAGNQAAPAEQKPQPRPYPAEIRGVHVTMALASLEGKLDEYFSLTREGLNTIELDVKDENGEIGFSNPTVRLAKRIGAQRSYYDAFEVVDEARARGVYLIGRVVVFEDPFLARQKPGMAIQRRGGGVWLTSGGLGWANPYDERVWKYNVDIAAAAAKAGFDEIQFDYIRFPSDGDLSAAVYKGQTKEPKATTIVRFLKYAHERLKPLGVRISADVFGLSATRDMGIGQRPRKLAPYLDTIYPMVYPSHYGSGEFNLPDPNAQPARTVALSLRDFELALRGQKTRVVPWLQDFSLGREYTLDDVRGQIMAARDARAEGYLLWNPSGLYTPGALAGK